MRVTNKATRASLKTANRENAVIHLTKRIDALINGEKQGTLKIGSFKEKQTVAKTIEFLSGVRDRTLRNLGRLKTPVVAAPFSDDYSMGDTPFLQ